MRLGNAFRGDRPAMGHIRMVRYGNRGLKGTGDGSEGYSYNVFDPTATDGVGRLVTVDEIKRFFDRTKEAWEPAFTPPTDPRATTGATMFAVLDGKGQTGPEYHVRNHFEGYPEKMEKGRSWGKNNDKTESVGLKFELYSENASGNEVWFDNARFETSSLLWEFSPDGGSGWYQFYDIPNKAYTRMSFPNATNMIRARVNSNNPDEWVQAFAIMPKPDYQTAATNEMRWNTESGETDFTVSDIGFATWTEAIGGSGVCVYYIYQDGVLIKKTRETNYHIENYDQYATYTISAIDSAGNVLNPYIEDIKIRTVGTLNSYVGYTNQFHVTFSIGGVVYDSRFNPPIDVTWGLSDAGSFEVMSTTGGICSIAYVDVSAGAELNVTVGGQQSASFPVSSELDNIASVDAGYFYYSSATGTKESQLMYSSSKTLNAGVFKTSSYVLLNPQIVLQSGATKHYDDMYMSKYFNSSIETLVNFERVSGQSPMLYHWKGTETDDVDSVEIVAKNGVGSLSDTVSFVVLASYKDVYYVDASGTRIVDQLNMVSLNARGYAFGAYAILDGEQTYSTDIPPTEFISSATIDGYYPGSSVVQEGLTVVVGATDIRVSFPPEITLSNGVITLTYSTPIGGETEKKINFMYSFY